MGHGVKAMKSALDVLVEIEDAIDARSCCIWVSSYILEFAPLSLIP